MSVATNIVEGSARRTTREYLQFVNVAVGSACEARYLLGLAVRLGFLGNCDGDALHARYTEVAKKLQKLLRSLENQA